MIDAGPHKYKRLPEFRTDEVLRFQPSPAAKASKARRPSSKQCYILLVICSVLGLSVVYLAVLPRSFATSLPRTKGVISSVGDAETAAISGQETDIYHVEVELPTALQPAPKRFNPIKRFPYGVVNDFYTTGRLNTSLPPLDPLDIVYLYVNSSSPYFTEAIHARAARQGITLTASLGHWRENGELKGAMRSALQHIDNLGAVHLITGVYPANGSWQAQVPGWLDVDRVQGNGKLKWHTHAETFRLPEATQTVWTGQEQEWRDEVLPNFSIFAIEGHFDRITGLSDQVILSNDDMFFMNDLKTTDFHSPLFGSVIRLDPGVNLGVSSQSTPNTKGSQWQGLQTANQLLSRRFPSIARNYQHHVPKTLSKAALDETAVIWADEIAEGATYGFPGVKDVDVPWLATWLGIERWREGLLWIWAVARMGDWGLEQRRDVLAMLGLEKVEGVVEVVTTERETLLTVDDVLGHAEWPRPLKTTYTFSSMDGHLDPLRHTSWRPPSCKLDAAQCFGPDFLDPTRKIKGPDLFKTLTFDKPECGNCLLKALISASGARGLDAILPEDGTAYHGALGPERSGDEPTLPLTKDWRTTNFSLSNVVRAGQDNWPEVDNLDGASVNLRRWSIKLLTRYAYVIGQSPIRFTQLHNWQQAEVVLQQVTQQDAHLAMLCLNDDTTVHQAASVKERIERWSEQQWPRVGPWERGADLHV